MRGMRRVWLLAFLALQPCKGVLPDLFAERMKEPPPLEIQQKFGGWENFREKLEQMFPMLVLASALPHLYWMDKGQFPSSWKEVCALDWLPVRCDLLVNPFNGRRLVDQRPGELGSLWLEKRNGGRYLLWYFYRPPEMRGPEEIRARLRPWEKSRRSLWGDRNRLDTQLKGAAALKITLELLLSRPGQCAIELGWSEFGNRFRGLLSLRDPYTGEPVEVILWESEPISPRRLREIVSRATPGQVLVVWMRAGKRWLPQVDVVVEEGKLLSDLLLGNQKSSPAQ